MHECSSLTQSFLHLGFCEPFFHLGNHAEKVVVRIKKLNIFNSVGLHHFGNCVDARNAVRFAEQNQVVVETLSERFVDKS